MQSGDTYIVGNITFEVRDDEENNLLCIGYHLGDDLDDGIIFCTYDDLLDVTYLERYGLIPETYMDSGVEQHLLSIGLSFGPFDGYAIYDIWNKLQQN